MNVKYITVIFFALATWAQPPAAASDPQQNIPLTVPASVPLRVYLTKRVPKKVGAPVEAKLLEGVYAFDRQVIPPGTQVLGHVSRLEPVSKFERTKAVLGGDFTPLHRADVEFTSLRLPDGREMALQTQENVGLNSIFSPKPPSKKPPKPQTNPTGVLGVGKQKIQDQINYQIDRVKSIPDLVRAPNKMERLSDYLMTKLPYHPQFVRNGTRFDAELRNPLAFGSEPVTRSSMLLLGTQPGPGSIVHARLTTPLDSSTAKQGQQVDAVLSQPLFSPDHKLILPEGTRLNGAVVVNPVPAPALNSSPSRILRGARAWLAALRGFTGASGVGPAGGVASRSAGRGACGGAGGSARSMCSMEASNSGSISTSIWESESCVGAAS